MEKPQSEAEVTTIENINSTINIDNGIYDLEVYARGTEDSLLVVTAGKKAVLSYCKKMFGKLCMYAE